MPAHTRAASARDDGRPTDDAAPLAIVPLLPRLVAPAVEVLARAYETNPINRRAFGTQVLERNRTFFGEALAALRGAISVALLDGDVVGVAHWAASPACQVPPAAQLRLVPAMVRGFGLAGALRTGRWLATWASHDPRAPHLHLGPIAVAPEAQGRGVGRALMTRYAAEQDAAGVVGYLETDRRENVPFYRRFGFELTTEVPVLGIATYLMRRPLRGRVAGGARRAAAG